MKYIIQYRVKWPSEIWLTSAFNETHRELTLDEACSLCINNSDPQSQYRVVLDDKVVFQTPL